MTAAAFIREDARPSRVTPYALVTLAILILSIAWQLRIGLLGDVVWLLMLDERWLSGERPYIDFLEINPPASLLIYAPEVWLARALGVASETIVVITGFVTTILSLGLAGAILKRAGRSIGLIGFAVALATFLFLPGDAFMERDVLAALFALPYLALAEARATRAPVDWLEATLAGLGVGLMVALKPPYALAVGLPALYVLWRAAARELVRMIEIPVAALVALGYAFIAWRFFPAYAQNMLPALVDVYLAVRQSAFELIHSEGGLDFLALMIFGALLASEDLRTPRLAIPSLAALGAFIGYYAQGKGWLYQAYPALAFASLFAGLAFERTMPSLKDTWLSLAALMGALALGLVVERWGVAMIVAAIAALAGRQLWLGVSGDTKTEFARFAAAAAFGATAAGFMPGAQPSDALGRALMRLGDHPTVMAITESFGFVHPMVRRVGAEWVQSVPNLVITSGARLLIDEHPNDEALATKLAPYIEADRDRLVADIETRKPHAIIVGPLNTRFHAALWSDPAVVAAMRDYRLVAVNGVAEHPGELWARRDLIGLRPSLAPGEAP